MFDRILTLHKKRNFALKISPVTFTGEIFNGKLHFLCSVNTPMDVLIGTDLIRKTYILKIILYI